MATLQRPSASRYQRFRMFCGLGLELAFAASGALRSLFNSFASCSQVEQMILQAKKDSEARVRYDGPAWRGLKSACAATVLSSPALRTDQGLW